MYPSCETVEYASTFLMSYCRRPMLAAKNAVSAPTMATTSSATGASVKIAAVRTTRNTPAVTIVAAWISAETGVGPAIASGSQTYSGICADLPVQPRKRKRAMSNGMVLPTENSAPARIVIPVYSSVPRLHQSRNIAMSTPKSPMRLARNAFLPASEFVSTSYQNPIRRYEQRPTPSHPMYETGNDAPSTSTSMNTMNRLR